MFPMGNYNQFGEDEYLRKLFVAGLYNPKLEPLTEDDLKEFYDQFGKVVSTTIFDGKPGQKRGFGFVVFETVGQVDRAMKNRPHVIKGRTVIPKRAILTEKMTHPRFDVSTNKLHVAGIFGVRKSLNERTLKKYFEEFGNVISVEIVAQNAMIVFDDYDPVDKCIQKTEHLVEGYRCDVKKYLDKEQRVKADARWATEQVSNKEVETISWRSVPADKIAISNDKAKVLSIQGIKKTDKEEELKKYFQPLGRVVQVICGKHKTGGLTGYGLVHFEREICVPKTEYVVDGRRFIICNATNLEKKGLKEPPHRQATGANREAVMDGSEARRRLRSLISHESLSITSRTSLGLWGSSSNSSENSNLKNKAQRLDSGVFESWPPQHKTRMLVPIKFTVETPTLFDKDSYPLVESDDNVTKVLAIRIFDTVKSKAGCITPYYQALVQCSDGHRAKILTNDLKKIDPAMLADVFERMLADIFSGSFSFNKIGDEYVCT